MSAARAKLQLCVATRGGRTAVWTGASWPRVGVVVCDLDGTRWSAWPANALVRLWHWGGCRLQVSKLAALYGDFTFDYDGQL